MYFTNICFSNPKSIFWQAALSAFIEYRRDLNRNWINLALTKLRAFDTSDVLPCSIYFLLLSITYNLSDTTLKITTFVIQVFCNLVVCAMSNIYHRCKSCWLFCNACRACLPVKGHWPCARVYFVYTG